MNKSVVFCTSTKSMSNARDNILPRPQEKIYTYYYREYATLTAVYTASSDVKHAGNKLEDPVPRCAI